MPVFKKGDPNNISSFRPISIIPAVAKILEVILKDQLISYFVDNNLFSNKQHGFRKGRSTITAVETLIQQILSAFGDEKSTLLTLLDLSKAFDWVSHKLLLHKMACYNIGGIALEMFESYFGNRSQVVTSHGATSEALQVTSGVPQGSALGPLCFLVLVNDVNFNALLYADDTTLISCGRDMTTLQAEAERAYNGARVWFKTNSLQLNEEKTQKLLCSLWTRQEASQQKEAHPTVKLLGINIDAELTWVSHIFYQWGLQEVIKS